MKRGDSVARGATRWSVAMGVLLVIFGILAIIAPFAATLAVIGMTGWLLIFAAIEQAVYAIQRRDDGRFVEVLPAALYILAGLLLLRRTVNAALTVTVIIAVLLVLDGLMGMILWVGLRRRTVGTGWLFAGGIVSLILGGTIWSGLPHSAIWVIGVLVGTRLIFKGIEQIMLSAASTRLGGGKGVRHDHGNRVGT